MKNSNPLQKWIISLALLLVLVILPLYAWKVSLKLDYTDFSVYYKAAERFKLQNWEQIYTLQDGASPFRYAPPLLWFFRPFAELPLPSAQLAWYFSQFSFFSLGFFFLYRTLQGCRNRQQKLSALATTCLSFLFVLRFCLDTFTIGQVSSLMFLGFALGLWGWVYRKPAWSTLGILIPTVLKIGPGILFGLFLGTRNREQRRAYSTGVFATLAFLGTTVLSLPSLPVAEVLWRGWVMIVQNDSNYYDASHYGSQSLKSVLLRAVKWDWISPATAHSLYVVLGAAICLTVLRLWAFRRPRSLQGRALFFSAGLFPIFWVMPETFKYSLTSLAFPVAFLFAASKKDLWVRFSLIFGILTLSLPGKDLIPDSLFFGIQAYSLPFLATVFLGIAVFREALRNSEPNRLARFIRSLLQGGGSPLGPWKRFPSTQRDLAFSVLVPVPLQSFSTLNSKLVHGHLSELLEWAARKAPENHEFLFVFYGNRLSVSHPVYQVIEGLIKNRAKNRAQCKILPQTQDALLGRGAALRNAFLNSSGKIFLITQLEQPCDIAFFESALKQVQAGTDLVRANRRDPESRFRTPVRFLSLVYHRHRLGLIFNRWVKVFLPVRTTDTHSGTAALSWRLAAQAFALQMSPDFMFDLELSLTATAQGYSEKDLPVTLSLGGEKSLKRVIFETLSILREVPLLTFRFKRGYFKGLPSTMPNGITADDWGISKGVNEGILELARRGIVRRTSVLANGAALEHGLSELQKLQPQVELGLHFNLTYGIPSSNAQGSFSPSPASFLKLWLTGDRAQLKEFVRREFSAQIQKLHEAGIRPTYLDGHHHIHMVPGLMDTIADLVRDCGIQEVRLPYDPASLRSIKRAPIAILARLARSRLKKLGFASRPFIYPKGAYFLDHGRLRAKLSRNPGAEVIVHPANTGDVHLLKFPDPYSEERVTEFHALRMLGFFP